MFSLSPPCDDDSDASSRPSDAATSPVVDAIASPRVPFDVIRALSATVPRLCHRLKFLDVNFDAYDMFTSLSPGTILKSTPAATISAEMVSCHAHRPAARHTNAREAAKAARSRVFERVAAKASAFDPRACLFDTFPNENKRADLILLDPFAR